MLDIGWSELLIIGVVALIVVGPKDLPKMFRTLGEITGKARAMAREFQRAMDAAADDAGVKDIARDLRDTASGRKLREAAGLDDMEREFRDLERDMKADPRSAGPSRAAAGRGRTASKATRPEAADPFDDEGADEDFAAELAPDLAPEGQTGPSADQAARNAQATARDEERLKRAQKAAEARRQAAEIRARREAAEAAGRADAAPAPPMHRAPARDTGAPSPPADPPATGAQPADQPPPGPQHPGPQHPGGDGKTG